MEKQHALFALAALALMLFAAGCAQQAPGLVGNDTDSHGCIGSAGYSWCEETQKCYRPWEENCTSTEDLLNAQARAFCGMPDIASVSVCGQTIKVVSSLDGGGTTFINANGIKIICPVVSPSAMSPDCKQLMQGSNCAEQKVC